MNPSNKNVASGPAVAVLVAGGAGYIGSHTCKQLKAAGYQPVVLDNLVQGHRWAVRWGPLIEGDVRQAELISRLVKDFEVKAAIHFAAHADVAESVRDPRKYYSNNVHGSVAFIDALLDAGVDKIVFSSTCATYGIPDTLPIKEEHSQRPINPYGSSKLMVEEVLRSYRDAYQLNSFVLRYFNAAGADIDGELGEDHNPETHLIPRAIAAALGKSPPIHVFGTDYDTRDGTAIRDYVHVMDLARAHVSALSLLMSGEPGACLNLGAGQGYSVREVISAIEDVSSRVVPYHEGPRRLGDPPVLVADNAQAAAVLSWTPVYSQLPKIVESAWRWHERGGSEGLQKQRAR